ncbi:hypothetical protein MTR67_044786 [Solanum verrucosum]|uniref:Uncharacterized protein n=1 Tax=Solanum verrucosum TaxID=315347 RepID=A0AAF0UUL6_SOLVR|nr:hypothetical protein MTR67_044786 [Solanum verrucosum]
MMTLETDFYLVPKTSFGRFVRIYRFVLYIFVISGGVQMIVYLTCLTTLRIVSFMEKLQLTQLHVHGWLNQMGFIWDTMRKQVELFRRTRLMIGVISNKLEVSLLVKKLKCNIHLSF